MSFGRILRDLLTALATFVRKTIGAGWLIVGCLIALVVLYVVAAYGVLSVVAAYCLVGGNRACQLSLHDPLCFVQGKK